MDTNEEIKILLKRFLDCKENTLSISEKALKSGELDAIAHVIKEQSSCIETITKIEALKNESLEKYKEGINITKLRILNEKKYLENISTGKELEKILANSFGAGILAQKEAEIWSTIEQNSNKVQTGSSINLPGSVIFGWGIFLILGIYIILKKNNLIGKFNSENVRLYFNEQQQKIDNFLKKISDNEKK